MSRLLSVVEARARMLDGVFPSGTERVPLGEALGRVLARPIEATRDQPPFPSSAMDGWAVALQNPSWAGAYRVIGESAAGRPFRGQVARGEAVRIFTGAPVPAGCDAVAPQEVVAREGDKIVVGSRAGEPTYIRPQGGDFRAGQTLLRTGDRLDAWRLVLAAAGGAAWVEAAPRPRLTLITTGEELVLPGAGRVAAEHQIYESATTGLAARVAGWGGVVDAVRHAPDDEGAIAAAVRGSDSPLLVFVGGASVGDYDLVKPTLARRFGLTLEVESVNLRPGKPTWFGRLADGRRVLGLPGNPASALVCAELFLGPLLLAWQGAAPGPSLLKAQLAHELPPTGPREHWMRAALATDEGGIVRASAYPDQDSSLVSVFAEAAALIRREASAPAAIVGVVVEVLSLGRL